MVSCGHETPIFVRPLTADERAALDHSLHSPQAFTLRHCQILLASARGQPAKAIGQQLGCNDQTVRDAIQAFHQEGLAALQPKSKRPHRLATKLTDAQAQRIAQLLHRSPREFGKATSKWTLDLLVAISWSEHLVDQPVSDETIRQALKRLGIYGPRAKPWITSPDPAYERKKVRDRLLALAKTQPGWVVGTACEVWWSRQALPAMHAFALRDHPLRLIERTVPTNHGPYTAALPGTL